MSEVHALSTSTAVSIASAPEPANRDDVALFNGLMWDASADSSSTTSDATATATTTDDALSAADTSELEAQFQETFMYNLVMNTANFCNERLDEMKEDAESD